MTKPKETHTQAHIRNRWDHRHFETLGGNDVAALLYRSNLLGADLQLTNYGGGNTSVKTTETDPLTGSHVPVMWIKGSGGDLGSLSQKDLSALYLDRLHALEARYLGIDTEDEMVDLFNHCLFDPQSKAPSIDTALHAFLPYTHVDHLHPDAAIAIAASQDGEALTHTIFEGSVAWIPWQRPGFDLGLKLRDCVRANPGLRGIMLGGHGIFSWGSTAYECYCNSLDMVERCAAYLAGAFIGKEAFGGPGVQALPKLARHAQAAAIAPYLRGLCADQGHVAGHFSDSDEVLEFVCSKHLPRLAPLGTSCPDHFLRTKIQPMVIDLVPDANLENKTTVMAALGAIFAKYREAYTAYYHAHVRPDSPPMRSASPVVILYPGIGMFTFAKNKATARIAAEFYTNAINVMRGAEAVSGYKSLPHSEAFRIEYWRLEEAKLRRLPAPKPLAGQVALITGSAGGIGKAIALTLAQQGAAVVLSDVNEERLHACTAEFEQSLGRDAYTSFCCDVTDPLQVDDLMAHAALAFGGVDIVVNNAGASISKPIEAHTAGDLDYMYRLLVQAQFTVSQRAIDILRKQALGGHIVNIVSKNALTAGPNNAAYGTAKAAQAHMTRLLAAELGPDKIRVNSVNPDAVITDSNIWAGGWAEGRAEAYGINVEELPAFYAKRTLLGETIAPDDVAKAVFALVGGLLNKTTGNSINVDGGIAAAFPR